MNRYIRPGLAAGIIAGALFAAPITASALMSNQPAGAIVSEWVVPYQCVPVAGCANVVNVPPVERTYILKPYQCVNVAGCASPYGW